MAAVFLDDGGQQEAGIAALLAGFVAGARRTLDVAIYDFGLDGAAASAVLEAFAEARGRGVVTRLVYNQESARTRPLPPPGFVDHDLLHRLAAEIVPVPGSPDLMHHKYVVRDAGEPDAAVWTGSTNWTRDSWTREENVVVRVLSAGIAAVYAQNFEELWTRRVVERTGHQDPEWVQAGGARVRAFFTPGRATKLVHELAARLGGARTRIRICSPVITSGPVLATLAEVIGRGGVDLDGCYDRTQMASVMHQWAAQPQSEWKLKAWETVRDGVRWGAKSSTPYEPGSVHDFMHAKCAVADDTVFVGSYNLSHSGEQNAENVLELEDPALAGMFAEFIERVAVRYRPAAGSPDA